MSEPSTLHITAEHADADGRYIGPDVSNWQGHIRIAANLGTVALGRVQAPAPVAEG